MNVANQQQSRAYSKDNNFTCRNLGRVRGKIQAK